MLFDVDLCCSIYLESLYDLNFSRNVFQRRCTIVKKNISICVRVDLMWLCEKNPNTLDTT